MAGKKRKATVRSRDREGTQRGILEAALAILAEEGFEAFGINGIARRAGCDKQLIYRYFGGLDGLADAVGEAVAGRFTAALERTTARASFASYAAMVEQMMLALLEVYRADAVLRRIVAWQLGAPSPLAQRLGAARSRPLQAWAARLRGELTPPAGVDAGATNALLIGAVQQVALGAASQGGFSGMALRSDEDWARMRAAIGALARGAYVVR